MKTYSFYLLSSGRFTGSTICCLPELLAANTPASCGTVEGDFDHRTHAVDLATGKVVSFERPTEEIAAEKREERRERARARVAQLELHQARPQRALLLDPNDSVARARLEAIEAEIAALRPDLT